MNDNDGVNTTDDKNKKTNENESDVATDDPTKDGASMTDEKNTGAVTTAGNSGITPSASSKQSCGEGLTADDNTDAIVTAQPIANATDAAFQPCNATSSTTQQQKETATAKQPLNITKTTEAGASGEETDKREIAAGESGDEKDKRDIAAATQTGGDNEGKGNANKPINLSSE